MWLWAIPAILALGGILPFIITNVAHKTKDADWNYHSDLPACPQYPAIVATSENKKLEKEVLDEITSEAFFDASLKRMQGAVQIPTESFDDLGMVGEDDRFNIFFKFHAFLEKTFPLM